MEIAKKKLIKQRDLRKKIKMLKIFKVLIEKNEPIIYKMYISMYDNIYHKKELCYLCKYLYTFL